MGNPFQTASDIRNGPNGQRGFGQFGAGLGGFLTGPLDPTKPKTGDPVAEAQLQKMLMDRAQGRSGVVDMQAQQMLQRLQSQQQSMAAGARPGQGAMALRLAMQNSGNVGAQVNQDAMTAKLQEQQMAQNALAEWLMRKRMAEQGDQGLQSPLDRTFGAASGVFTAFGGKK